MKHTAEHRIRAAGPPECNAQEHRSDTFDHKGGNEDAPDHRTGAHHALSRKGTAQHSGVPEGDSRPGHHQIEHSESNDAQAPGLNEQKDHNLTEPAPEGGVNRRETGNADGGNRGEHRIDEGRAGAAVAGAPA